MYFQLFARHLHSAYHISLCVLLMQDNQMASQRTRDLGGDGLMAAFASAVGAIANALPPQLLVARLMESVKVLCCQSLLCLFVYV